MPTFRPRTLTAILATTMLAAGATGAQAAKPRLSDFDAELKPGNRLELKIDARHTTSVRFLFSGRSVKGYVTDRDDDGEREYSRTVKAGSVKVGKRTFKVRACGADGCVTRSFREYVEYDD